MRLAGWTIAVVLAIGAAACDSTTSGNDSVATAGGATPNLSTGAGGTYDEQGWIRCLREQGLTVDDPEPGSEKPNIHEELVSPETLRTTTENCRRFNPVFGQPKQPMTAAEQDQYRRFAQCMRDRGIDMPDEPVPAAPPSQPGSGERTPSGVEFEKALRECADTVPGVATTEFPGGKS
ncbi:MAG TPA: hypothetical protein VFC00_39805 [Micromonosporaceae bacterium]|nr:hypothetical protein [Micromonosporaceae bacterium]